MDGWDGGFVAIIVFGIVFGGVLIAGMYYGSQPSGESVTGVITNITVAIDRSQTATTVYLDNGLVITIYRNDAPVFRIGGNYTFYYCNIDQISSWKENS